MMSSIFRRIVPALLLMASTAAHAGIISETSDDGADKDLQSLFNDWVDPSYDVQSEFQTPGYWTIGATGTSAATLIIEIAGNAKKNKFGLFDKSNPDNRLEVYSGESGAGTRRSITYFGDSNQYMVTDNTSIETAGLVSFAQFSGSSFGFYLDGPGGTFFSAPALNNDHVQMVAFQGKGQNSDFIQPAKWMSNEWVLAWEDLPYLSSDQDFNDLVMIIESVTPVPEPGTITLLGAGVLGLLLLRRRTSA